MAVPTADTLPFPGCNNNNRDISFVDVVIDNNASDVSNDTDVMADLSGDVNRGDADAIWSRIGYNVTAEAAAFLPNASSDVVANLSDVSSRPVGVGLGVGVGMGVSVPGGGGNLNEVAVFLMVYLLPVIFTLGILGNAVSFVIFLSEKMRRVSTNVYLAALSASNGVFLMAVGVAWTDMVGWKLMHVSGLCQATVYLTYCSGFVSVWLVVCITVENFIINFFLRRASCHCTVRRALALALLLTLMALLLYDFAIWTTGVMRVDGDNNGGDNSSAQGPQFYCQTLPRYQEVVEVFTLIDVGATLGVPSVLILALVIPTCARNVSCAAAAAGSARRGGAAVRRFPNLAVLSRRERALLRVTRLLCVIIVSYVLLTAPSHLNKLRHLLGSGGRGGEGEGDGGPSTDMIIVFIVQMLYFLSFSMNFVYFLIWGKNFRDRFTYLSLGLYRLLCLCRQKLFRRHTAR